MTHHEPDATSIAAALELLSEHGFDRMADALQLLLNEAMKIERSEYLEAGPWVGLVAAGQRILGRAAEAEVLEHTGTDRSRPSSAPT